MSVSEGGRLLFSKSEIWKRMRRAMPLFSYSHETQSLCVVVVESEELYQQRPR